MVENIDVTHLLTHTSEVTIQDLLPFIRALQGTLKHAQKIRRPLLSSSEQKTEHTQLLL
jgi:hypothetical protein